MKCVAYLRVSTEKQAEEGNGLDSQKRDILQYAGKNNLLISEWYIDDGYTGSNMDRPALQKLIADCMNRNIDIVIAFKLDRISRNMVDGIYIIEKIFIPNKVEFKCVHDSISYDSPMEQAYTQMMAVFAQLDKNTMMLRMRGGMLERIKQGYWHGGGNLPYCYSYDKNKGILVPIPEKAEKARQAMDLYLEGYSDLKIQLMLGFKTELIVRNILTSVTNIGMIKYKGKIYQGLHEPIFDKEKFQLAQEYRAERRKMKAYARGETHILTGLCYCGVCGCKMRYQLWKKRHKIYCCSRDKYLSYLPNHDSSCNNSIELAKDIEKQVGEAIKQISLNLSAKDVIKQKGKDEILIKNYNTLKSKLKRLYETYAEGSETVKELIEEKEAELKNIEKELEKEKSLESRKEEQEIFFNKIKKIADIWDKIDNQTKNKLLKSIVEKIVIVNKDINIVLKNF